MKSPYLILGVSIVAVAAIAVWARSNSVVVLASENDNLAAEFSPKSGLFLPAKTRESLGLKLVEVEERTLEVSLPLSLQVYRTTSNSILTCSTISTVDSASLSVGQKVSARLNDGRMAEGSVEEISEALQRATGLMELLVRFDTSPAGVDVGSFLQATAKRPTQKPAVTIPRSALVENSEGQFTYTVSGERLVRTAVTSGAADREFIEITDGLYNGDQVVSHPVMSLWLTELAAVKGGQACCVAPPKGK